MTVVGDPIGALLVVAHATLEALERGDFDAFDRLADRRDALLATLRPASWPRSAAGTSPCAATACPVPCSTSPSTSTEPADARTARRPRDARRSVTSMSNTPHVFRETSTRV